MTSEWGKGDEDFIARCRGGNEKMKEKSLENRNSGFVRWGREKVRLRCGLI